MIKKINSGLSKTLALAAVLIGAMGSVGWVLYTGRNNKSYWLVFLFLGWVLSPFVALAVARSPKALFWLSLLLPVVSLVAYSGVLSPPGTRPAAVFLLVPLVSWILIGVVWLASRSKR